MKGFIAMLLFCQAVSSISPYWRNSWKSENADHPTSPQLITNPQLLKPDNSRFPTDTTSNFTNPQLLKPDNASFPVDKSFNWTFADEDLTVSFKQSNVTVLRVTMHQTNPSEEPKEFELRTHPDIHLLGIDQRGRVRENPKKKTTFMIVLLGKNEFVLCAIRERRRYIASLDGRTRGIKLRCTDSDLVKEYRKNKACTDEIQAMRKSKVAPHLFTLN